MKKIINHKYENSALDWYAKEHLGINTIQTSIDFQIEFDEEKENEEGWIKLEIFFTPKNQKRRWRLVQWTKKIALHQTRQSTIYGVWCRRCLKSYEEHTGKEYWADEEKMLGLTVKDE